MRCKLSIAVCILLRKVRDTKVDGGELNDLKGRVTCAGSRGLSLAEPVILGFLVLVHIHSVNSELTKL